MSYSLLAILAFFATSASFTTLLKENAGEDALSVYLSRSAQTYVSLQSYPENTPSLQEDITEESFDPSKQWKTIVGAFFIVLIIVGLALIPKGILIYFAWKKSSQRREFENKEGPENEVGATRHAEPKFDVYFEELRELAIQNDPIFLKQFTEVYVDLTHNLLEKHPDLSRSELSLCAMIYLNFSSKEIAEYTFIQHRSVQTNRSRLRKKMHLSPDVDLYRYIRSFS